MCVCVCVCVCCVCAFIFLFVFVCVCVCIAELVALAAVFTFLPSPPAHGVMQVMFSTIFASLFGRRNLGKIQAVLVATNLVGVACGPLLINAGHTLRGSYDGLFAGIGCLQLLFFLGLCCLKAPLHPGGAAVAGGRSG